MNRYINVYMYLTFGLKHKGPCLQTQPRISWQLKLLPHHTKRWRHNMKVDDHCRNFRYWQLQLNLGQNAGYTINNVNDVVFIFLSAFAKSYVMAEVITASIELIMTVNSFG